MPPPFIHLLTRAVSWTAGVFDGMCQAVAGAMSGDQASRIGPTEMALLPIRTALLGRHRKQIAKALGNPPAVWAGFDSQPRSLWEATTWYYPHDPVQRRGIAIRFENDRARKVEFIHGPQ